MLYLSVFQNFLVLCKNKNVKFKSIYHECEGGIENLSLRDNHLSLIGKARDAKQ